MIKIENQLDPKFKKWYIGKSKGSSFADFGCYLFCWAYEYSIKMGRQVSPKEVDGIFVKEGVYVGDLIDSAKAAKALGLQYLGIEKDINNPPKWFPSVKRVDVSARPGKQYHFVVRSVANGKRVILDPIDGVQRDINYYEKLVGDTAWKQGAFEYRLIKIK